MKYLLMGLVIVSAHVYGDVNAPSGIATSHSSRPDAVVAEQEREQEARKRWIVMAKKAAEAEKKRLAQLRVPNAIASRFFRDAAAPLLKAAVKDTTKTPEKVLDYVDRCFFRSVCSEEELNQLSQEDLQKGYEKAHQVLKDMNIGTFHWDVYLGKLQKDEAIIPALEKGRAQAAQRAAEMIVAAPLIAKALDKIMAEEKAKADTK